MKGTQVGDEEVKVWVMYLWKWPLYEDVDGDDDVHI